MSITLVPGQRFVSTAEPELGLGTVLRHEGRILQVVYQKAGEVRNYAITSAPLVRAEFKVGDRISGKGAELTIEQVEEAAGLRVYIGEGKMLLESELDDQQSAGSADERLMAGVIGTNAKFSLRKEALERRALARGAMGFGIHSAKIGLLPHQLRVVDAALRQPHPRVLLADEVGLGKTIEAGLILSRLLASGRATRALILVPEPLIFQWFIELMRRFNLKPAIFDAERVTALLESDPKRNPFDDDQVILTDIPFLVRHKQTSAHVLDAGWDVVIVDEAHHLEWRPEEASPAYQLVENLGMRSPSLILLTATPEQLGQSGHFARLRLLDPARYSDLAHFEQETAKFQGVSAIASSLIDDVALTAAQKDQLRELLQDEADLLASLDGELGPMAQQRLLDALIDRHGTGRVMFRNRRASVGGFPQRLPQLVKLPSTHDLALQAELLEEFRLDVGLSPPRGLHTEDGSASTEAEHPDVIALSNDPRFLWLKDLIDTLSPAKIVLICRTPRKVVLLEAALRLRSGVKVARFHDGLSLAQRDRNAAFFADPEGARVLLCSEIGSEGRNFQFAHHLVLWDLPVDPDLLEQRIGRLDRIGQTEEIKIHHCAVAESAQAALARWFHEGFDAFAHSPADGRSLYLQFGDQVVHAALACCEGRAGSHEKLNSLIAESGVAHQVQSARMAAGRDRLLELASQRSERAASLKAELSDFDERPEVDDFIQRLFEHFGVDSEDLGPRTYLFDAEYANNEEFATMREGGEAMTFARSTALSRDDVPLLRLDHPMAQQALDLLIAGVEGSTAVLIDPSLPPSIVMLQTVYVLECVADKRLDISRFLPPQALSVCVDTKLGRRDYQPTARVQAKADENPLNLSAQRRVLQTLVPPMLNAAHDYLLQESQRLTQRAVAQVEADLGLEIDRLQRLRRHGGAVRETEITVLRAQHDALMQALPEARLRLDAVRLIASPAFLKLK